MDASDLSDDNASARALPETRMLFTRKSSFFEGLMAPNNILGEVNSEFQQQESTIVSQNDESAVSDGSNPAGEDAQLTSWYEQMEDLDIDDKFFEDVGVVSTNKYI